jgi:hypothetical protein
MVSIARALAHSMDEPRPGVLFARRGLSDAFRAPGSHVFVVKLNYWLTL